MEIQSKKQLIELLHTPLNSKDEKKLEKLFSLSRRNYFKVVLEDNFLCISYENEYIKAWDKISLNNISTLKEVIHLKNILFKESQKQIVIYDTSKAYYYIQFDDYSIEGLYVRSFKDVSQICFKKKSSNVIKVENNIKVIYYQMLQNKAYFKDVNDLFQYVLCIKDIGDFRKGMLVEKSNNFYNNVKYLPNPVKMYENLSVYRVVPDYSCNLSLVTLEQLEGLSTNKHDCYKKEFGCQRGCTSYCYSDSANKFETKLKNILINLWKECFVNN